MSNEPNIPSPSSLGGVRGLLADYEIVKAKGRPAVLAIVVATSGSTYQKAGALLLLDQTGVRFGVLSGGCLEPQLERHAKSVLSRAQAALVRFNTDDDADSVFGSGLGCRGEMEVLLLPLIEPEAPLMQALSHSVVCGCALELQCAISGVELGTGVARVGTSQWSWSHNKPTAVTPFAAIATTTIHLRIAPPPRILILGAGPETEVLIKFSRQLGWFSDVIESRGRWSGAARNAGADCVYTLGSSTLCAQLAHRQFNAALVMSHDYSTDLIHLQHLSQSNIDYIGLLGPPARRDALLMELGASAQSLRSRLHAPMGMNLGGRGPEAIALSIVAGLQRYFSKVLKKHAA